MLHIWRATAAGGACKQEAGSYTHGGEIYQKDAGAKSKSKEAAVSSLSRFSSLVLAFYQGLHSGWQAAGLQRGKCKEIGFPGLSA